MQQSKILINQLNDDFIHFVKSNFFLVKSKFFLVGIYSIG